ncbi:hypothetical protein ACFVQB_23165 [Paenibacillus sp. NPDC057886]|uniref:hypothetical protein n=1 Tax=Paenibacillus sp. NPDC057886 TaxID=3346270 RepID=UPI0036B084CB
MDESKELERRLSDMLTEGDMEESGEADKRERQLIPPKYEVRIQTERDPIVEETMKYRDMAREVDDRYDRYLERSAGNKPDTNPIDSDPGESEKQRS